MLFNLRENSAGGLEQLLLDQHERTVAMTVIDEGNENNNNTASPAAGLRKTHV